MGIAENMSAMVNKMATQAKERHIALEITSGKQQLNMGMLSMVATMRENAEGKIYFDKVDDFFEIIDYSWEGPRYKTVTTTNTVNQHGGKEKTKKKGGLGGAVVGTLLMPGIGTAVGYAMTHGSQTKHSGQDKINTTQDTHEEEVKTNAKLTLRSLVTGQSFVIGFKCDTKLDADLQNFSMHLPQKEAQVSEQKDAVSLLKEYKGLLDEGIITQAEFDKKKKELLGL